MKRQKCSTCLWWWDLNDTGEHKCYRDSSPLYHERTEAGCGCEKHESLARNRKNMNLGHYGRDDSNAQPYQSTEV